MITNSVGIKNNSKKISELKPYELTSYKGSSWIPIAQYDPRIDSYTNFALNLGTIVDYSDISSYNAIGEFILSYDLQNWTQLNEFGKLENPGYITQEMSYLLTYSYVAQNIITYSVSYTNKLHGWQYLFGNYNVTIPDRPNYKFSEQEEYIIDINGKKLINE